MFEYWETEPTEEETESAIAKAAELIRRRRLETPAIMAIEMHKPLAYIGAHAAVAFSPFLVPFLGYEGVGKYTAIFKKPENLDRLIDKLAEPVTPVTDRKEN